MPAVAAASGPSTVYRDGCSDKVPGDKYSSPGGQSLPTTSLQESLKPACCHLRGLNRAKCYLIIARHSECGSSHFLATRYIVSYL